MISKRFFKMLIQLFSWSIFMLVVSACSGAATQPQQIASYPRQAPKPIATLPAYTTIVYQAYIELQVSNVDRSAENAAQLAYERGGYLISSQSWYVDNQKNTTLVFAVPTVSYESLRRALLGLGDMVSESVSGNLTDNVYGYTAFSNITLHLQPSTPGFTLPTIKPSGWNPARTFERAFTVFIAIFGFLADILIWIIVVGGPFIFIYLLTRVIIKRLRHPKRSTGQNTGDPP